MEHLLLSSRLVSLLGLLISLYHAFNEMIKSVFQFVLSSGAYYLFHPVKGFFIFNDCIFMFRMSMLLKPTYYFILLILVFHTMYFYHIHPSSSSSSQMVPILSYPLNFVVLIYFNPWAQYTLPMYSWVCGHLLEYSPPTRRCTPKENWLSLSISVSNRCSLWWDTVNISSIPAGVCPACACAGLVHAITTAMDSYVQLPYSVRKTRFPCSQPSPMALKIFPPPLLQWPLSLGRRGMA